MRSEIISIFLSEAPSQKSIEITQNIPAVVESTSNLSDMGVWGFITHSGPVVFSVLLLLVACSATCWAIIFYKYRYISQAQKETSLFFEKFWNANKLDQIYEYACQLHKSPVSQVFKSGYIELAKLQKEKSNKLSQKDSEKSFAEMGSHIDNIERALRRSVMGEILHLEKFIDFLGTIGSSAPFIGLFGTVWGIMNSFHEIGKKGVATLATVAPGISEALIATATGLAAAIPAYVAFNFFNGKIHSLGSEMENFSMDFLNIIRRNLDI